MLNVQCWVRGLTVQLLGKGELNVQLLFKGVRSNCWVREFASNYSVREFAVQLLGEGICRTAGSSVREFAVQMLGTIGW